MLTSNLVNDIVCKRYCWKQERMNAVSDSVLTALGYDLDDPDVQDAHEDAHEHMNLIESLVSTRNDQGLSQSEVAQSMDATQSTVSNFERLGGDPKLSTIMRYARAVGARVRHTVLTNERDTGPAHVPTEVAVSPDNTADEDIPALPDGQWESVSSPTELKVV